MVKGSVTGREPVWKERPGALAEAATLAGYAPSIHNRQPWHWLASGGAPDLYAEPGRQLAITDPDGGLAVLSCGAALHHARAALAAEGWRVDVARLPDPTESAWLARITLAERIPVTPDAMRLVQTIRVRHTDRQPLTADR
jgi:nitroreductase